METIVGIANRDKVRTMQAYGTSEGVEKAWDSRGRGRAIDKHNQEVKKNVGKHGTENTAAFSKRAISSLRREGDAHKQGIYPENKIDGRNLHMVAKHVENGDHAKAWAMLKKDRGGGRLLDYVPHLEKGFRNITGDRKPLPETEY